MTQPTDELPDWLEADSDADSGVHEAAAPAPFVYPDPADLTPARSTSSNTRLRIAPPKPEIHDGVDIHRVVDDLSAALGHPTLGHPRLFRRASSFELVDVAASGGDQERALVAKGTPILRPVDTASLRLMISKYTDFRRAGPPSQKTILACQAKGLAIPEYEWFAKKPGADVLASFLAFGQWPVIRTIVGVTETPLLRPDGTILQTPGYDEATGYLYVPNAAYPAVPDSPSVENAQAALAELVHVFQDFPHVTPAHAMVPIAAALTILARPAIDGPTPAFVFEAPTPGTGKSLQADVVGVLATGRLPAHQGYPENEEEMQKTLSAYALDGAQCILLDNIHRPFGGGDLDKCLTSTDVAFRLLGSSTLQRLPWRTVVLGTGNNIAFTDDGAARRVLRSRIESPLERPEDRTEFAHPNLVPWCHRHRPRLVSAALTVLRARALAQGLAVPRWGSFDAWAALIPPALTLAGGAPVLDARPRGLDSQSDELSAISVVLRDLPRLAATLDRRSVSTKQLLGSVYPPPRPDEPPDGWDDLREALETLSPPRMGIPLGKSLGQRLNRFVGRPIAGRRLVATFVEGTRRWASERAEW